MESSVLRRALRLVLSAVVVGVLSACGGGGGGVGGGEGGGEGGGTSLRDPLPTLVQDILPTGDRLDLRDRRYFPAQAGDSWTYDVVRGGNTIAGAASLSVTSSSGDDAWLSETVQGETTVNHWRRTADGIVAVAALQNDAPAAAAALVGDLLEFPEPFYAVGAERRLIRQGSWGDDLDGDGQAESFRLEMTQVLVGFETVNLPLGSAEAAHFRTTVRLTWNCCASTASVGSFCAAWMRPARISASSALATWSESLALGLTAEKGEDMEWVARAVGA